MRKARERQFDIDGLRICGREWGDSDRRVIALHGWLDNAASFDRLAPLLEDVQLLALDLPGHGLSDHKPAHGSYNLWDDLLVILAVADAMGWQRFTLMGHSRGAMIAALLAAAAPDRVERLIALDGLLPPLVKAADAPSQLANYLRDYRQMAGKAPRAYRDLQQMIDARRQVMPMTEEAARTIVSRAARRDGDAFYWRNDPRLRAASAFKLTAEHCDALLKSLCQPVLVILAERGLGRNTAFLNTLREHPEFQIECLPGGHHQHMETEAAAVAAHIQRVLNSSGQCKTPDFSEGVSK